MLPKEQNVFEINEIRYTCLLIAGGKRKGYSSPDVQFPLANVIQARVAMGYIHKASWSMT